MTMKPNFILGIALAALAVTFVHGQQPATPAKPASAPPAQAVQAVQTADAPLPDAKVIVDKVKSRIRLDRELQSQYTYLEKRRDVKLSKLGKVTVGSLRTFEV